MLRGESETDPATHRVADETDALVPEAGEHLVQARDLERDRTLVANAIRGAEAWKIGGDDSEAPARRRQLLVPIDARLGPEAVHEDDGIATAAAPHADARPRELQPLRAHPREPKTRSDDVPKELGWAEIAVTADTGDAGEQQRSIHQTSVARGGAARKSPIAHRSCPRIDGAPRRR